MAKYDLHIHTTCSDGTLSPYAVIEKAKREGLSTISITDHETILAYKNFVQFAQECGVEVISGIEINVGNYVGYHFVGYGIIDIERLENYLKNLKIINQTACLKTLELLIEKFNINILKNELLETYSKDGLIDKKMIAKELIKRGYAKNTKEAYDVYIGRNAPAYSPIKKITDKEVIDLIHSCGGICVWAHPQKTKHLINNRECRFDELKCSEVAKCLTKLGLDGLEVYNNTNSEEENYLKKIAYDNGLVITGGTDFHTMDCGHELGCERLSMLELEEIKTKISLRQKIYQKEIQNERFFNEK